MNKLKSAQPSARTRDEERIDMHTQRVLIQILNSNWQSKQQSENGEQLAGELTHRKLNIY